MEILLITQEMLDKVTSDLDFFKMMSSQKIRCENVAVYDKIMDYIAGLRLPAQGNRETLTIVT